MKNLFASIFALVIATSLTSAACAQTCEHDWRPFDPTTADFAGLENGMSAAAMWDADGPGPAASRLVVAGFAQETFDPQKHNVASYDFATRQWSYLADGFEGSVSDVVPLPGGRLAFCGDIRSVDETATKGIIIWDGSTWSSPGGGLTLGESRGIVSSALALPTGDLVVSGQFSHAGGVPARGIALWDGTQWHALDAGINSQSWILELALHPDGSILAHSLRFGSAACKAAIIRWDGSSWSQLGSCFASDAQGLAIGPNGQIIVVEQSASHQALRVDRTVAWDGQAWSQVGPGLTAPDDTRSFIADMHTLPSGAVIAVGSFSRAGSVEVDGIARWDGTTWSAVEQPLRGSKWRVQSTGQSTSVVLGSALTTGAPGATSGNPIMHWDGFAWVPLTSGFDDPITQLLVLPSGDLVARGGFQRAGSSAARSVARFDGARWHAMGDPLLYQLADAPMTVDNSGRLIAVDSLLGLAFWTGPSSPSWQPLAPFPPQFRGDSLTIATLANGDIVIGGRDDHRLRRWNGTAWSFIPGMFDGDSLALCVMPDGSLIASGRFQYIDYMPMPGIARWTGSAWEPLGSGIANGFALALLPEANGDLLAAGVFSAGGVASNGIARWNGSEWASVGSGILQAYAASSLTRGTDGTLYLAGGFELASSNAFGYVIALRDGVWTAMGRGVGERSAVGGVSSLAALPSGEMAAAGSFLTSGSRWTPRIARWARSANCIAICDSVDFNADGLSPSDQDLIDFFSVLAGGPCSAGNTCNDIDFNNDGLFPDDNDLVAFLRVLAGGAC